MRPGVTVQTAVAALLLVSAIAAPAQTEPLSRPDCQTLLRLDAELAALLRAAERNQAARSPGAEVARTTGIVLDAASEDGGAAERLCASLVVESTGTTALLTGYYRPLVPARRSPEGTFRHPLYALPPPELRDRSRAEIDAGALAGTVPVVAWLADPIEAFFIHVQGSALLALPDGRMAVGYAGSNGRTYTSIGARLVADGRMRREDVSMESLKSHLRGHPDERDAILHANERYIYFQEMPSADPIGSLGVPLTDGRSVAADPAVYPPGTLLFVRPHGDDGIVPPRLVFVQDRGSAITGPARLDLYVGTGDEAGRIAGPLQQRVEVFVLRSK